MTEEKSFWKNLPISRTQMTAILKRDMPEDAEVKVTHVNGSIAEFSIRHDSLTEKRRFDPVSGVIGEGYLLVNNDFRNNGIGRTVARNEAEFFRACVFCFRKLPVAIQTPCIRQKGSATITAHVRISIYRQN
jgi:hypothetical protein